ncbi:DUF2520 domain-containing protein [bacterium]|nr:DUF2520 domain-containing protein [bacterium]
MKERIAIIGCGRLGSALALALDQAGLDVDTCVDLEKVQARHLSNQLPGSKWLTGASGLSPDITCIFIAVSDDSISCVGDVLYNTKVDRHDCIWAHTSGLWPAEQLGIKQIALKASFHPAMLFTENSRQELCGIPIAIEGDSAAMPRLCAVANALGGVSMQIRADQKALYHASCVMASNTWIALLDLISGLAGDIDSEKGINWLMPLIKATLNEVEARGTKNALTGPVLRGDINTVAMHLRVLDADHPEAAQVYRLLSRHLGIMSQGLGLSKEKADKIKEILNMDEKFCK